MDETAERAVKKVITEMRASLADPLTIDDMARTAMFSKYHFSRLFQRATGVSPRRFLSALRIQRAKELLVSTSLNVAEISHRVGYSSVGTFSSRFASSVGLSPIAYRRSGGLVAQVARPRRGSAGPTGVTVRGTVHASPAGESVVFVGVFPSRLPEGRPVTCTALARPGPFAVTGVPEGSWYLLAYSAAPERKLDRSRAGLDGLSVGSRGPLTVRHNTGVLVVDLRLRPISVLDPPVLPVLLDARSIVDSAAGDAVAPDTAPRRAGRATNAA